MFFAGITINHRTAPLELREALHLNSDEIKDFIGRLRSDIFTEGFVLSTCNRTEIFGFPKAHLPSFQDMIRLLLDFKPVQGITEENFEAFFSCSAVKHVLKVASGIDSQLLGDSQILAQVKEAFFISAESDFSGTLLNRLAETASRTGKRTIKETNIGTGAVSVSYAATQVISKIFSTLESKSALIIGAGETGRLAALHLRDREIGKLTITNRTTSRAELLAEEVLGDIVPFNTFKSVLDQYDIIVSATSADDIILTYDDVKKMQKARKGRTAAIMDIAVPRDVDNRVADIESVFYHDVDSLNVIIDQNLKKRESEIPNAIKIVNEEADSLLRWYNTLEVVPTIKFIRDFFEDIRLDELEKIKNKVTQEDYEKLEDMSRRLIGRLLHNPTINMRKIAESGANYQDAVKYTYVLKDLFKSSEEQEDYD